MITEFEVFFLQMKREFLLHLREPKAMIYGMMFFVMAVLFFPLTLSPDPVLLRHVAPGLLWVAMFLAMVLASDRLFLQDYQAGVIEQWLLDDAPMSLRVFAKVAVHWVCILVPLLVLSPCLGCVFGLSAYEIWVLCLSFFLATPTILFLCALACAFSTGRTVRGVFVALIIWPFALPAMMLGSLALQSAMQHVDASGFLALQAAVALLSALLLPWATGSIIRISLAE